MEHFGDVNISVLADARIARIIESESGESPVIEIKDGRYSYDAISIDLVVIEVQLSDAFISEQHLHETHSPFRLDIVVLQIQIQ